MLSYGHEFKFPVTSNSVYAYQTYFHHSFLNIYMYFLINSIHHLNFSIYKCQKEFMV